MGNYMDGFLVGSILGDTDTGEVSAAWRDRAYNAEDETRSCRTCTLTLHYPQNVQR